MVCKEGVKKQDSFSSGADDRRYVCSDMLIVDAKWGLCSRTAGMRIRDF